MNKFKVGDSVECIIPPIGKRGVIKGKVYTIDRITCNGIYLVEIADERFKGGWLPSRFRLLEPKQLLEEDNQVKELDLSKVKPEEIEHVGGEHVLSSIRIPSISECSDKYVLVFETGFSQLYNIDGSFVGGGSTVDIQLKPKTVTYVKSMLEILTEFPDHSYNNGDLYIDNHLALTHMAFIGLGKIRMPDSVWAPRFLKQVPEPTG